MQLKVASIQLVSSDDIDDNIAKAESFIVKAAQSSAEVAVLPENFATYGQKEKPDIASQQEFVASMSAIAKKNNIALVAGSYPLSFCDYSTDKESVINDGDKRYASSLIFNAQGNLLAQYNKIHLFDAQVSDSVRAYKESDEYKHGDSPCNFTLGGAPCAVAICYDLRFPELFTQLAIRGAQVIFVPAAFTVPTGKAHWELLLRARAVETQCYIVAPNQGGEHPRGRATWGHSMIVSPWGDVIGSLETGEGMMCATLDLDELAEIRQKMPVHEHHRLL